MSIEEALFTKLSTTPGVTALVGTRIYPVLAPQDTSQDYVVYERVSGNPYHQMTGPSGLSWCRLSYLCFAGRYATAKTIAAALRGAIDGFQGTLSGVAVGSILSEENQDFFDETTRRYMVAVDFVVQYDE